VGITAGSREVPGRKGLGQQTSLSYNNNNNNNNNKRLRCIREESKEVLWCFNNVKEKTLKEKSKEVYKLWSYKNPVTRMNIDAKALLNQKK